jgi:hypothetical protein
VTTFSPSEIGNYCNNRGNRTCLVNCHRNVCFVLCVIVGTRLANLKLVAGYFTVGTIFTKPLDGNGRFCQGEVVSICQSFCQLTLT